MWESRAFLRGFSKQLWTSASSRSCRRPLLGLRMSIAAAFSTGRFLFCFLVRFSFFSKSLVENRLGRVTNQPPY